MVDVKEMNEMETSSDSKIYENLATILANNDQKAVDQVRWWTWPTSNQPDNLSKGDE